MAKSEILPCDFNNEDPDFNDENPEDKLSQEFKEFLSSLPRDVGWTCHYFYQYESFWHHPFTLQGAINFQRNFKARSDDVLLVSMPKSGTTWMKALSVALMNRGRYTCNQHPLLTNNPHHLIRHVEIELSTDQGFDYMTNLPSPRLLATHIPYISIPESFKDLNCRIIYLCRNPRDVFISLYKFCNKLRPKARGTLSLEEAFELFCRGIFVYGPFWEHVLEYWNESLKRPESVLFLNYEDLKGNTVDAVKKIADFLECPFSLEEEREGKVEEILKLCSFDNLRNLEVNKTGILPSGIKNESFFRKGEVGDWANHFTPHMSEMLNGILEEKFQGSGLTF